MKPHFRRTSLGLLAAAFTLAFASGGALAATITVKKGGTYPTIESGVSAASAGDTVLVQGGVYQENVIVPGSRAGLKLTAKGAVVIDARPTGGAGGGPGIWVEAQNVTITGFQIQNALGDPNPPNHPGYGIQGIASGLTVKNCSVFNCSNAAIDVSGDFVTVNGCTLAGNNGGVSIEGSNALVAKTEVSNDEGGRIQITGDNAKVSKCQLLVTGNDAIYIEGVNATVEKNKIRDVGGTGISVFGPASVTSNQIDNAYGDGIYLSSAPGSTVKNNKVTRCKSFGIGLSGCPGSTVKDNEVDAAGSASIFIDGDDCVISGNELTHSEGDGIDAEGNNLVIEKNRTDGTSPTGIALTGSNFTIAKNTIENVFQEGAGIYIGAPSAGGLLQGNKISYCANVGIYFGPGTSGSMLTGNKVTTCGSSNGFAGIHIEGNGHSIEDNNVSRCGGDAIRVSGDNNLIAGNTAKECTCDGIDVEGGSNNLVNKNVVAYCSAEGIENNGAGTMVSNNTIKGCRIDLANDGTGTETGNKYDTGDWSTAPEID